MVLVYPACRPFTYLPFVIAGDGEERPRIQPRKLEGEELTPR